MLRYVLIAGIAFLVYSNTLSAELVWDDRAAIAGSADVTQKTGLAELWKHDFWGQPMASPYSHKSYRPLTVLTYRLNHALHSLKPEGYHACNVLMHMIASTLLLALADIFLKPLPAALSALIFAVHPVHTEAVAGIVGRADILGAAFMLLAILAFRSSENRPTMLIASLVMAIAAFLSKEMAFAAFPLLIAMEIILRDGKRLFSTRIMAIMAVAVALLGIRISLHGGHSLRKWQIMENHIAMEPPSPLRFATIAHTHYHYMRLMLWPSKGSLSYDHGFNSSCTAIITSWADARHLQTLIAYATVMMACLLAFIMRSKILRFSLLATLIPMLPALNVAFFVGTALAERLLYIPSKVWGGDELRVASRVCRLRNPVLRKIWMILLGCLIIATGAQTYERNWDWKDEPALYESGFRSEPYSVKVLNNLAQVMLRSGSKEDAERAELLLARAIKLNPGYPSADFNRGLAASTLEQRERAIHFFKVALKKKIHSANKVHAYLAQELMHIYYEEKNAGAAKNVTLLEDALAHTEKAIHLQCVMPLVHFTRANALFELGNPSEAIEGYRKSLELNENPFLEAGTTLIVTDVLNQMALALKDAGRVKESIEAFQRAVNMKPDFFAGYVNIGVTYSQIGQYDEAEAWLNKALQLEPGNAILLNNIGNTYEKTGRLQKALEMYEAALARMPGHTLIQNNIRKADACASFQAQASRLSVEPRMVDITSFRRRKGGGHGGIESRGGGGGGGGGGGEGGGGLFASAAANRGDDGGMGGFMNAFSRNGDAVRPLEVPGDGKLGQQKRLPFSDMEQMSERKGMSFEEARHEARRAWLIEMFAYFLIGAMVLKFTVIPTWNILMANNGTAQGVVEYEESLLQGTMPSAAAGGRISIVVLGLGCVGKSLLRQIITIWDIRPATREYLHVAGVMDTSGLLFSTEGSLEHHLWGILQAKDRGESVQEWMQLSENERSDISYFPHEEEVLRRMPSTLWTTSLPVLVDCTAAGGEAHFRSLLRFLEEHSSSAIVLANKKPISESTTSSKKLAELAFKLPRSDRAQKVLFEATVGAGLPVLKTLNNMRRIGDHVQHLEAVLSGTLSFVTNRMASGDTLADAFSDACDLKLCEPDILDDVKGTDAARKAVILARILGSPISTTRMQDVTTPADAINDFIRSAKEHEGDADVFLSEEDAKGNFARAFKECMESNCSIRHSVSIHRTKNKVFRISAGFRKYYIGHPLYSAAMPSEATSSRKNIFLVGSRIYTTNDPLIIGGPGAGCEETASAVTGDLFLLLA
eukprot:g3077.t1